MPYHVNLFSLFCGQSPVQSSANYLRVFKGIKIIEHLKSQLPLFSLFVHSTLSYLSEKYSFIFSQQQHLLFIFSLFFFLFLFQTHKINQIYLKSCHISSSGRISHPETDRCLVTFKITLKNSVSERISVSIMKPYRLILILTLVCYSKNTIQ